MKIDDKYKWLARDKNGELWAYDDKPFKSEDMWGAMLVHSIEVSETYYGYSFIKWEDEQPTSIEYAKEVIETVDKSHFIRTLDEPEITEEQALNKLAESYPYSADGINAILQAQLAGYSPVSTVTFFKGNELAFTEDTFWEYMNDQYRLDKEELFGKLKENNYLKKHSIVEIPVIPQFVAEYIKESKENKMNIRDTFHEVITVGISNPHTEVWIEANPELFSRAWLDDYTIEKEQKWVVKTGKGYFSGYDETKVTYVLDDMPGALDGRIVYDNLHEAETDADKVGGTVESIPAPEQATKIELPKTRQVLVKFFDNEEYKTELTEDAARELIEFLEANKHE